jgi:excisionase family DNA binding protein
MKEMKKETKLKQGRRYAQPEPYLTTGQVAAHSRVSVPTVQAWIRAGRLVAFKTVGGHRRIGVREFERFLQAHAMLPYRPESASRILIVDDDRRIVALLVDLFGRDPRGLVVETATDGYDGLIALGAFRPTLLVLDAHMPRVDGIEMCRRVKASPDTKATRILGMTGYPERIPELRAAGADACLAKPFSLEDLKQAADRLLAGAAATGEGEPTGRGTSREA